jgi:two-component system osmolarity sensor histidine kinase EnvZ
MAAAIPLRRRLVPRTLFGRSLLIVILPILVLQASLATIFYSRHWETVTRWLAIGLAGEVALIAELIDAAPDSAAREAILSAVRLRTDLDVRLADRPWSERTLTAEELGLDQELERVLAQRLGRPYRLAEADSSSSFVLELTLRDTLLQVIASRKRVTTSTATLLLVWMVSVAAVLIVVALYFLRRQLRPIRRLADAAESFGKGRDVGDFKLEGAIEIRQAGQAFNGMRQRILRFMNQRTEMLAAVSHDLRTPLTRMKLELAMLERKDDPALAELRSDVAEMERLVESYLQFARGEGREQPEPQAIRPLLDEIAERALRAGAAVEVSAPDGLVLPLRALAIRRCLGNLVDNAARYGKHVRISAAAQPQNVTITIEDDGPGIPAERREDVFQPFFRLDASRNPQTGGVGLGLTIARDVVLGHGGEIELGDSPLGGLQVTLRLPR